MALYNQAWVVEQEYVKGIWRKAPWFPKLGFYLFFPFSLCNCVSQKVPKQKGGRCRALRLYGKERADMWVNDSAGKNSEIFMQGHCVYDALINTLTSLIFICVSYT